MHRRTLTSFVTIAVVASTIFLTYRVAQAITLVPPTLEFGVDKGQVLKTAVKVYNEGTSVLTLFTSTANFKAADENGTPSFDDKNTTLDLAGWIGVTKGPITLQPGDRLEVPVTITVPADAEPGSHTAALFFGNQPPAAKGGSVVIESKVGTLILLRVNGDIREAASVAAFTVDGKKTLTHPPVNFSLRIANDGNVHIRPTGVVTIRNMLGGVSATLPINLAEGAVLPASIRHFMMTWKPDADRGSGFFQQLSSEAHNFGLGTYTAEADITYGQSKQNLIVSAKFTIFPWRLLTVLALGLILAILILVWAVKAYNRMIINRAEAQTGKTPRGQIK